MGGGKAPKEYLLECAKKDHNPLMSYSKDTKQEMTNLAEFLSKELEYSPELIYDLLKKYEEKRGKKDENSK
jgi:hypothetical protein